MWNASTYVSMLLAAIVGSAMLYSNFEYRGGIGTGNNWAMTYYHSQGWPIPYRTFAIQESYNGTTGAIQDRTLFDSSYQPLGILINLIVFCAITVGVVFTSNIQLKNRASLRQSTVNNALFFLTFTSILAYVYTDGIWAATVLAQLFDEEPNVFWYLGFHQHYTVIPLTFGATCVTWAIGFVALRVLRQSIKPIGRARIA